MNRSNELSPFLGIPPEVREAAKKLGLSLTVALGTPVTYALVIGTVQRGSVHIRRLTNAADAETAKRLLELAATAPMPVDLVEPEVH